MSNTWRMASAMSTPRSFIGTGLIGDCVFAIGGYDGEDYLQVRIPRIPHAAVEAVSCICTAMGDPPFCPAAHVVVLQTVERYDAHADQWQVVSPLNAPRSCCGVATYDNLLYVAGGYNTDHCLSSVEMYDARDNRWRDMAPLGVERSYLSMIEFSGSLYAIGGLDSSENALDVVEKYDPAANR